MPPTTPAAAESVSSRAGLLRATTPRVTTALLANLAALAFFHHVPHALRWPVRGLVLMLTVWLVLALVLALRRARLRGKTLAFSLILAALLYGALTLVCHVFITLMSRRDDRLSTRGLTALPDVCRSGIQALIDDDKFNQFTPEIGWVPRPGHKTPLYTISSQGARATADYPLPAPDPARRILCLGDSFTYGTAVGDKETYPAQAAALRPGTEWINLGIPGACLVQSWQRYLRDGPVFGGSRVVVGFMTSDAQRSVNAFRPLLNIDSGCPFTKPFAKYVDGHFSIEPNPSTSLDDFKRLLEHDREELPKLTRLDYLTWHAENRSRSGGPVRRTFFYIWETCQLDRNLMALSDNRIPVNSWLSSLAPPDPYGRELWLPESRGFKALTATFALYHDRIVADGRQPLFVIIPGPLDVENFATGRPCQYTTLLDFLKASRIPHLDFLPALTARHKGDLSEKALFVQAHYRGPVNKELATEIIKALQLP